MDGAFLETNEISLKNIERIFAIEFADLIISYNNRKLVYFYIIICISYFVIYLSDLNYCLLSIDALFAIKNEN